MLWGWDPPGAAEPPSTSTTPYPGLLVRLFLPKAVLEDVQLPGRVGGCTPSPPNAGRQLQVLHPTLGWCFSPGQHFPLFPISFGRVMWHFRIWGWSFSSGGVRVGVTWAQHLLSLPDFVPKKLFWSLKSGKGERQSWAKGGPCPWR